MGKDEVIYEIDAIIKELRAAMFLTGTDKISKMSDVGAEIWI